MRFEIGIEHNTARLQASLAFANTGAGNSTLTFYATMQPERGEPAGGTPLVVVILAKPCGTVTAGVLTLSQADPAGDLVAVSGTPLWARWLSGDGALVGDGDVSDGAGNGFFKIAGTNGTMLYAGGSMLLGATALG